MMRLLLTITFALLISSLKAQINSELNSKVYNKHKGEILFSDSIIDLNTFHEKDIRNSFNLDDEIYAQVLLKQTLEDCYKENGLEYDFNNDELDYNYVLHLYVDNILKTQWYFESSELEFKHELLFDLVFSTNHPELKRIQSSFINKWVAEISTLKEGKRQLKFEILPLNAKIIGKKTPVLASGTLMLNIEKGKLDQFLDQKSPDIPPVSMINRSIEDRILQASKDVYSFSEPLAAFITDVKSEWSYNTDNAGNIISREIIASVLYKLNTSKKCFIKTGNYLQLHRGYGNFGPMQYDRETIGYYNYDVPCWRLNK